MFFKTTTSPITTLNESADFWYYEIGVNVIPADTKNKTTFENWSQWKDKPMPIEVFESYKKSGYYNNGLAIIPGKIWRGPSYVGKYLVAIDLDNKKAIEEFCKDENGLQELNQQTLVEQTSNPDKMHLYFIVEQEIPNKTSDKVDSLKFEKIEANEIPALEVKSNSKGIMFVANSPHKKDGYYQIIGTKKPHVFNAQDVEDRISLICDKYGIPYGFNNNESSSNQIPIEDLWKTETIILEGHNRHLELLRIMESELQRNRGIKPLNMIKQIAQFWNQSHCKPPLNDHEFEKQWKCAFEFVGKSIMNNDDDNDEDYKSISSSNKNNDQYNNEDNNDYEDEGDDYDEKNNKIINPIPSVAVSEEVISIDENLIKSEITSNNFIEYVIKQVKKTVKCEDVLIRQILYTGLSSIIQDDPINLGILAPTSEGKTYPVEECIKYFPNDDVEKIGSMSTKVLVRKKGVLLDKNLQPIEDKIKELVKQKNSIKDPIEKMRISEEIDKLYEDAKTVIDLRGKILVFLEPPQREVWEILKPILSHDAFEIKFPFVNKTDREGHQTKDVIVRGWPSCIFCSAKDESNWSIWPEVKSRCLITSPNMIPQKYEQSTKLIATRYGKPNSIQQKIIISDNEIELAKKCILLLKQKIKELGSINNYGNKISYWIPYAELLQKELPSNKGTDVRFQKRVFAFLRTIPVVKFNLRKLLILEGYETSVIADLHDLKEVLSITQNFDGIPKYKVDFFNDVLSSLYHSKTKPDSSADGTKAEDIIAVTAKELCEYYKKINGKSINTDNLKKTYLNELENNGLIDHEISKVHGKQYIYYPLVDPLITFETANTNKNNSESSSLSSNLSQIDQISQYSSKIYEKITMNLTTQQLFHEIMQVYPHRIDLTKFTTDTEVEDYLDNHGNELKILGENGNRLKIRQFIQDYINENFLTQFDEK